MSSTEPAPLADLVDQIHQLAREARQAGQPPPGRPTLVRETGATEHQVRRALEMLANQPGDAGDGDLQRTSSAGEPTSPAVASPPPAEPPDDPAPPPLTVAGDVNSPASRQPAASARQPGGPAASTPPARRQRPPRPWPLLFIGLGAAVAVWGGWVRLGELTGFGPINLLPGVGTGFTLNTAVVLPLSAEFYGAYALRTLLASDLLTTRTRRFARRSFIASLAVGGGAQIASHVMGAASVTTAPWPVTTLVSCVPVLVLGLATGLATLVKHDASARQPGASAGDDPGEAGE